VQGTEERATPIITVSSGVAANWRLPPPQQQKPRQRLQKPLPPRPKQQRPRERRQRQQRLRARVTMTQQSAKGTAASGVRRIIDVIRG